MRYVILRDDDTNALTPVEYLERLYRPFLDRGLPVNLAVIPKVRTNTQGLDRRPEGYLLAKNGVTPLTLPIAENPALVRYLQAERGYHVVQHGYHHSLFEFETKDPMEAGYRLEQGTLALKEAGFAEPHTFVAPYDRFSRVGLREAVKRFRVISTGWFELRRVPLCYWPCYVLKKVRRRTHWRVGRTVMLAHPGCLLSCHRPYDTMLDEVKRAVSQRRLTVLVTHWWEYFRGRKPDEPFIRILHETAAWLAEQQDLKVISFEDRAGTNAALMAH